MPSLLSSTSTVTDWTSAECSVRTRQGLQEGLMQAAVVSPGEKRLHVVSVSRAVAMPRGDG